MVPVMVLVLKLGKLGESRSWVAGQGRRGGLANKDKELAEQQEWVK